MCSRGNSFDFLSLNSMFYTYFVTFFDQDSKNNSECSEKAMHVSQLECAFELLDSNFFNERKVIS